MSPKKNRTWRIRELCNWTIETEENDWREWAWSGDCGDDPENHVYVHAFVLKYGKPMFNRHLADFYKEMKAREIKKPTWDHR